MPKRILPLLRARVDFGEGKVLASVWRSDIDLGAGGM